MGVTQQAVDFRREQTKEEDALDNAEKPSCSDATPESHILTMLRPRNKLVKYIREAEALPGAGSFSAFGVNLRTYGFAGRAGSQEGSPASRNL